MGSRTGRIYALARKAAKAATMAMLIASVPAFAQQTAPRDPAEPPQAKPEPKILPRPAGAIFSVLVLLAAARRDRAAR